MSQKSNISKWFLVLGFVSILFFPIFKWLSQDDLKKSPSEKRSLKQFPPPPISLTDFKQWPKQFDDYYSDQFGFRIELNSLYSRIIQKYFVQDVTLGKDDWFYLGSIRPNYERFGDPIGDYTNQNNFTTNELNQFVQSMNQVKVELEAKAIPFFYFITPSKHTIYPENLPSYIKKQSKLNVYDQLNSTAMPILKEHYINVLPLLTAAKERNRLYYQYDTHWNMHGANLVQYELLNRIAKFFPEDIKPYLVKENEFKNQDKLNGDLVTMVQSLNKIDKDPRPQFPDSLCQYSEERDHELETATVHTKCHNKKLTLLMFRDSYSVALIPFIARQFGEAHFYWEKLSKSKLDSLVKLYQPDVVVEQMVERKLPHKYNY